MYKKIKPENLNVYLRKIDALFPEFKSPRTITSGDIQAYYAESYWGYAIFHSWGGAIHMAMSPHGKFSASDYFRQAEEVGSEIERMGETSNMKVLEVGCGRGFNIRYLAQTYGDCQFIGVDLSRENLAGAAKDHSDIKNISFLSSDFHSLSGIEDEFIDLVFAVEALCHATHLDEAFKAVSRVLVKGGRLIVFDGFRGPQAHSSPEIYTAVEYAERAMAVPSFKSVDNFILTAKSAGLSCEQQMDRSSEIMPNLVRLSDFSKSFFKVGLISRLLLAALPRGLVANAVAGLLMAVTVQCGAHSYMKFTFTKS